MQKTVNANFDRQVIRFRNKFRAQQLKGKRDRRQQHQQRIDGAGMTETGCPQTMRDGQVVDQVHRAYQARTDQHNHAAAQDTGAQSSGRTAATYTSRALAQHLGSDRYWSITQQFFPA